MCAHYPESSNRPKVILENGPLKRRIPVIASFYEGGRKIANYANFLVIDMITIASCWFRRHPTEFIHRSVLSLDDTLPYLMTLTSEHREGMDRRTDGQKSPDDYSIPSAYALRRGLIYIMQIEETYPYYSCANSVYQALSPPLQSTLLCYHIVISYLE
jgi:hypothetical protein